MKIVFVVTLCIVAVSARSLSELEEIEETEATLNENMQKCLLEYNVKEARYLYGDELFSKLSDEDNYCLTACFMKQLKFMKPDGSVDLDNILKSEIEEDPVSGEEERRRLIAIIAECRNKAGTDDCEFVKCMEEKDDKNNF